MPVGVVLTALGEPLEGLLRPGRLVLGVDASLGMLEIAAADYETWGWGPRLACADVFRLPLRDGAADAIAIAFGMRNLRPRAEALAEMARVLAPGGTLAVLEATAPRRGFLAPFHAFYARHVIPLLGRLSPDPAAYRYLSESIFEFGAKAGIDPLDPNKRYSQLVPMLLQSTFEMPGFIGRLNAFVNNGDVAEQVWDAGDRLCKQVTGFGATPGSVATNTNHAVSRCDVPAGTAGDGSATTAMGNATWTFQPDRWVWRGGVGIRFRWLPERD